MSNDRVMDLQLFEAKSIEKCIYSVRGQPVMLDHDVAFFFGTTVSSLNRQMKRNATRFPEDFCFQLSDEEVNVLRCQNGTSKSLSSKRRYNPYAYTEEGIIGLAGVIKSEIAAKMSVEIARKFIQMRKFILENGDVLLALAKLQNRQLEFENETNQRFDEILKLISQADLPKQAVFHDGQFYSAYEFVSSIIGQANNSVVLIDPYFDAKAFAFLKNKKTSASLVICKSSRSKITDEEIRLFESEYGPITITANDSFHDRFLIIDGNKCYSLGASLNRMGKRVFAINKIEDKEIIDSLIKRIKE